MTSEDIKHQLTIIIILLKLPHVTAVPAALLHGAKTCIIFAGAVWHGQSALSMLIKRNHQIHSLISCSVHEVIINHDTVTTPAFEAPGPPKQRSNGHTLPGVLDQQVNVYFKDGLYSH